MTNDEQYVVDSYRNIKLSCGLSKLEYYAGQALIAQGSHRQATDRALQTALNLTKKLALGLYDK